MVHMGSGYGKKYQPSVKTDTGRCLRKAIYVLAYMLGDTDATRQISHEGMEKMEVTCTAAALSDCIGRFGELVYKYKVGLGFK